jgi:hypothetical protein
MSNNRIPQLIKDFTGSVANSFWQKLLLTPENLSSARYAAL